VSHLLDEVLAQAANGDPVTTTLSSESVAVLMLAGGFLDLRDNWLDRGVDPLDEVTDADWDAIEKLVANLYDEVMVPLAPYPEILEVPLLSGVNVGAGALSYALSASQFKNGGMFITPDANGNAIEWHFYARKGTYNLTVLGITANNYAKVSAWVIGGTLIPIQDWYSAVAANNVKKVYVVDVPADGNNTIQLFADGKNAASSNYRFVVGEMLLSRTGD